MAESTVLEDVEAGKKEKYVGYFKAKILPNHKSENTDLTLKQAIEMNKSVVFSDDSTSYVNIADNVELHII